jgi:hypothetical protein
MHFVDQSQFFIISVLESSNTADSCNFGGPEVRFTARRRVENDLCPTVALIVHPPAQSRDC